MATKNQATSNADDGDVVESERCSASPGSARIRRSGMATSAAMTRLRQRPGQRDDRLATAAVAQVVRVDRRRLGPADEEAAEEGAQRQQRRRRVDRNGRRVEGQPALVAGRRVAQPVRGEGVAELVDREGHEQEDRDRDQRSGADARVLIYSRPSSSSFFCSYSSAMMAPCRAGRPVGRGSR